MSFQSFDFNGNKDFQQYLSSLYPEPKYDQLDQHKRKWYKRKIDPNFDISSGEKSQQEEQKIPPPPRQEQSQQEPPKQQPPKQEEQRSQQQSSSQSAELPKMYVIENIFKCLYFPALGLVFMSGFGLYLNLTALIVCCMALTRNSGKIQFSKAYLAKVIPNEFAGNLMYILSMFLARGTLVYQMPIAIHFLIGACEFWTRMKGNQMHPKLLQLTKYVKFNRLRLLLIKQKIEVYLLIYSIIGIFLGISQITQVILLFQMIALKNKINGSMIEAQKELKLQYKRTFTFTFNPRNVSDQINKVFGLIWKGYEKAINIF